MNTEKIKVVLKRPVMVTVISPDRGKEKTILPIGSEYEMFPEELDTDWYETVESRAKEEKEANAFVESKRKEIDDFFARYREGQDAEKIKQQQGKLMYLEGLMEASKSSIERQRERLQLVSRTSETESSEVEVPETKKTKKVK